MIEEENSLLQHQLVDSIRQSLAMNHPDNAAFLAERLLAVRQCQDYRGILADSYMAENKHYKVMALLKDCQLDSNRYKLAMSAFRCNKFKQAQRALLSLQTLSNLAMSKIDQVPCGSYGLLLLGEVLQKQQRYQQARQALLKALQINPSLWVAYQKLGKFVEGKSSDIMHAGNFFNEHRVDRTDSRKRSATKKSGPGKEMIKFLHRLAIPYQKMCYFECHEAIQQFEKLPNSQLNTGWVQSCIGKCYMESVKYQQAEKHYCEAQKLEPYRLEGLQLHSSCLWQLKKSTQLCHLAHTALEKNLYSPQTWIIVGNCFSLQKQHDSAIRFFTRAIQLNPQNPYGHSLCGMEYVSNEDFNKARKCFQTALNLDVRHYNAWWGLGSIFFKQEKYNEASDHFARAISINPRNPVLYSFMGMTLTSKRQFGEALKYFEKSESLDPRNGLNRYQKANTLVKMKRYDLALVELQKLSVMMPKEAPIPTLMGKIYKRTGQIDKAHQFFTIALDLQSKDSQKIKGLIESLHNHEGYEMGDDME